VRRRIDEWRATLYDAPFESGPESAHLAFVAISRKFAALDRHPAREASSLGSEARSSQHGSRGSETNSRLPCARSIPSDSAPSCGCNRRFSQTPIRAARALRAALRPATCAQAIPIRHLLTLLRIDRQSGDRHSKQDNSGQPAPNLSDRSRQMNPDGRRRPRIGIPRRVTLSSFARPTIENEPARRLRLEAGFTSAVYDTSYQGSPPIRQTR
jgi:hypothetical protein